MFSWWNELTLVLSYNMGSLTHTQVKTNSPGRTRYSSLDTGSIWPINNVSGNHKNMEIHTWLEDVICIGPDLNRKPPTQHSRCEVPTWNPFCHHSCTSKDALHQNQIKVLGPFISLVQDWTGTTTGTTFWHISGPWRALLLIGCDEDPWKLC